MLSTLYAFPSLFQFKIIDLLFDNFIWFPQGGFILDMGVHFVAGLRMVILSSLPDLFGDSYFLNIFQLEDKTMFFTFWTSLITSQSIFNYLLSLLSSSNVQLVGCEIASLSAMNSHVDKTLPPPDNISSML